MFQSPPQNQGPGPGPSMTPRTRRASLVLSQLIQRCGVKRHARGKYPSRYVFTEATVALKLCFAEELNACILVRE
jgi:hypothetical protein